MVLHSSDDLSDYKFTKENITIGRLKLSTLCRYNYSLDVFWEFLKDYNIELNTFENVSYELIEGFVHYLLANVNNPSTRSLSIASLKHHIKHGQLFEWDGLPLTEVFDGTEQRTLQTEETLKSMLIDDDVMDSIDTSLRY